jgi:hypothetical protein
MKNTAINAFKYTGIVTLSQYIGTKKIQVAQIHNEGGKALFRFLTNCLVGNFNIAKLTMPAKVMVLERTNKDEDSATPTYAQLINGTDFTKLLTSPTQIDNIESSRVRYSFIIQKETVESFRDFDNLYLGLYTNEATVDTPENYVAVCKLEVPKTITRASIVVDWDLVISNINSD